MTRGERKIRNWNNIQILEVEYQYSYSIVMILKMIMTLGEVMIQSKCDARVCDIPSKVTNKQHSYDGKDDDADGDNLVGENRANVPPKVDVVKGGDSFYCNAKNECCEENRKTQVEKEFF